jgi:S-formylglutathione hydrolase FrmB
LPRLILYLRPLLFALLFGQAGLSVAARVDTLAIPGAAMRKTYRANVVLPAAYAKQKKAAFPVLYLLHGAYGHFSDWLAKTPDKQLVHQLADQYNLIVVMPEGETFRWYIDSPINKDSQFETYLTREVIQKIDATYRTVRSRQGRVITGLSMGGHGALSLYLATRHPDLYGAAGSMSGTVDINTAKWELKPEDAKRAAERFEPILGPLGTTPTATFAAYTVLPLVDKMKTNGLPLIIDYGVDDFLIEPNRELHRRLVYNGTPHDYAERPGTWNYWQNSLPYHVLFLYRVLQANAVTVP